VPTNIKRGKRTGKGTWDDARPVSSEVGACAAGIKSHAKTQRRQGKIIQPQIGGSEMLSMNSREKAQKTQNKNLTQSREEKEERGTSRDQVLVAKTVYILNRSEFFCLRRIASNSGPSFAASSIASICWTMVSMGSGRCSFRGCGGTGKRSKSS
jgi:hypothetical protein